MAYYRDNESAQHITIGERGPLVKEHNSTDISAELYTPGRMQSHESSYFHSSQSNRF